MDLTSNLSIVASIPVYFMVVPVFMIITGLGIAGIWLIDIVSGKFSSRGNFFRWKEGEALLWPHLLAEFMTAFALIAAGGGIIMGAFWSMPLAWLALGALIYTCVNSSGWVLAERSRLSYGIPIWISLAGAVVSLIILLQLEVRDVYRSVQHVDYMSDTELSFPDTYEHVHDEDTLSLAEPGQFVIPRGFGYVHEFIPDAVYDIRYHGTDNFLGVPVDGYLEPVAILTIETLEAMKGVADEFREKGFGIIVFDGYRPQKAVNHFVRWARDTADTLTKQKYYQDIRKAQLFSSGYIASRSGHTRGSTVDLTLYDLDTGIKLDMGSGFDFFGPISAHGSELVSMEQLNNRNLLRGVMIKHGFVPYNKEWWHYTLRNEPFPDTYFDFDVF